MTTVRAVAALALIAACGGKYSGTVKQPVSPEPQLKGGLDAAALPYQLIDARTGHQVDEAAFWDRLSRATAVCVGEEHPNPHHHWVQLKVVRELAKRLGNGKVSVGLEMVQRPFQGPLDDYAHHKIDADTFQSRAGWAERWGYNWGYYAPTLDAATAAGGSLIALNAPRELVKKIVRHGLESLTPDEKRHLPQLKLDDVAHRAWFDSLMESMGGAGVHSSAKKPETAPEGEDKKPDADAKPDAKTDDAKADGDNDGDKADGDGDKVKNPHGHGMAKMPSADRIYTAQVLWDETMADGSARWIKAHPGSHLVILAGNGHCHDTAIVNRLKRRGIADVLSVRAVIDDREGSVSDVLAKPINDYVFVLELPKPTADKPDVHAKR